MLLRRGGGSVSCELRMYSRKSEEAELRGKRRRRHRTGWKAAGGNGGRYGRSCAIQAGVLLTALAERRARARRCAEGAVSVLWTAAASWAVAARVSAVAAWAVVAWVQVAMRVTDHVTSGLHAARPVEAASMRSTG